MTGDTGDAIGASLSEVVRVAAGVGEAMPVLGESMSSLPGSVGDGPVMIGMAIRIRISCCWRVGIRWPRSW